MSWAAVASPLFLTFSHNKSEEHEMTSTKLAVDAIARRIGLPIRRVRAVAAYLTAAGGLPAGAPGKSPELSPDDVVALIVGSVVDVPLRAVAAAVDEYRALVPPGYEASPPTIMRMPNAGAYLDVLASMAANDAAADVSKMKVEIVTSWPEVSIHHIDGSVVRFAPAGSLHGHWQSGCHRTSTTINGAAFVDALRDLFEEKK